MPELESSALTRLSTEVLKPASVNAVLLNLGPLCADCTHVQRTPDAKPVAPRKKSSSSIISVLIVILLIPAAALAFAHFNDDIMSADATVMNAYSADFLSSAIGPNSPTPPPGAQFPHIVYEEGVLFVRGVAADEDGVAQTVAELQEIFGEDQVVAEFALDPNFVPDPNQATEVYFTENVLFSSGSAAIAPQFLDVLGTSARFLQISPETTITITGHTDSNGTEESNLALSQARVDAARQAMIDEGGDPERITAIGVGEAEPIADNSTAAGRQQNRRVELTISPAAAE